MHWWTLFERLLESSSVLHISQFGVMIFQEYLVNLLSLPLMNSLNQTKAAIFPGRLCFLKVFPFLNWIVPWTEIILTNIWMPYCVSFRFAHTVLTQFFDTSYIIWEIFLIVIKFCECVFHTLVFLVSIPKKV